MNTIELDPKTEQQLNRLVSVTGKTPNEIVREALDKYSADTHDEFPVTCLEDVFGCTNYTGPAKTLEEIDAAVAGGIRKDHARG